MCIERAYSSYRLGNHKYLDIYKAYRPVIYTWIVTLLINVLPVLLNMLTGVYARDEWRVVIPACKDTYIGRRVYFGVNMTETIINRTSVGNIAGAVVPLVLVECIPLFLFLYIGRRNLRLMNCFAANHTHESIAIGVTLQRNNLATKVCVCVRDLSFKSMASCVKQLVKWHS
jgi:hypothetical protein